MAERSGLVVTARTLEDQTVVAHEVVCLGDGSMCCSGCQWLGGDAVAVVPGAGTAHRVRWRRATA